MNVKIQSYIQLLRLPNGITAVSNILAAGVIVSAGQLPTSIVFLCLASLFIYYAGMIFNDCFDVKEDAQDRPDRPIPSGNIKLSSAWLLASGLMVLGVIISSFVSLIALYAAIGLSILVLLYDGVVKQGLFGALTMGACRYANWLLGAAIVASSISSGLGWIIALPIGFYIAGLTFLSKQEVDAANVKAINITALLLFFSLLSVLFIIWTQLESPNWQCLVLSLATLGLASPLVQRTIAVKRDFTPQNIQRMIGWMIIAIIPFDAFMVALFGHYGWAVAILLLLPLCRWLSRYAYMT
ncbi:hypothetical protein C2869_13635 [Saccharobesus litoralis]|uniref:Prenyltransferase n=1 Tax=Saccharobesus litoralis TaxID=2172099 RepID=A0A2S0VT70_9ALTE|nr:UbiA family prenyltransferase [Saccharobesus litoralis]AWB67416.1 hypothetical protein C2869_13635 [Saccharobesus litoralis]